MTGAWSSNRLGCLMKISLETRQSCLISASESCTCFPGLALTASNLSIISSRTAASITGGREIRSTKSNSEIEESEEEEEKMKEGGPGCCPGLGVWILAWLKEREKGDGGGKSYEKHSWLWRELSRKAKKERERDSFRERSNRRRAQSDCGWDSVVRNAHTLLLYPAPCLLSSHPPNQSPFTSFSFFLFFFNL